jgi:peptide-methionine (S)-S-oxide reductase
VKHTYPADALLNAGQHQIAHLLTGDAVHRSYFDPTTISILRLLKFFFQNHGPSLLNRQANDLGMSYRLLIFYMSLKQRQVTEETVADVDASCLWPGEVMTEIAPAADFWATKPEH